MSVISWQNSVNTVIMYIGYAVLILKKFNILVHRMKEYGEDLEKNFITIPIFGLAFYIQRMLMIDTQSMKWPIKLKSSERKLDIQKTIELSDLMVKFGGLWIMVFRSMTI